MSAVFKLVQVTTPVDDSKRYCSFPSPPEDVRNPALMFLTSPLKLVKSVFESIPLSATADVAPSNVYPFTVPIRPAVFITTFFEGETITSGESIV